MYREDPEYRAALNATIYPHLVNPWHMKPADPDDPTARMVAGAAEEMLIGADDWLKLQWDRFLCIRDGVRLQEKEVFFDPGFTAFEWKLEGDQVKRWVKQPTGRTGLYRVRFHPRLPHTIQEWKTNPDGTFGGILQDWRDDDTGKHDSPKIPAANLVRWTFGEEGTNWEGDPTGRPAWAICNLRRTMINDFGVMLYRFAYGTPGFEEIEANLDLDDEAYSRLDTIAREYATSPHQFIRTPFGVKFTIHEADLKNGAFFWKLYDGLGREVHRLFGTQYIFSGEGYGSRSEHDSKFDVSLLNAAVHGQTIAGPLQPLLADWTEWNGWPRRLAPTLEHYDLQSKSPAELITMMKEARDGGFLTKQSDDEIMVRQAAHLPNLTEDALDAAEKQSQKAEGSDDTTPPGSSPKDTPGETQGPEDGPSEAGLSSSCSCGETGLAADMGVQRVWRPHPGHQAAIAHAAQFGPLCALAEEYFDGASSRSGRERRIQTAASGLVPIVERLASKLGEQLAGKTIGEAAKVKIKDADLVELRRFLVRQYRAAARLGQDEVKREIREQKDDPGLAAKLADAVAAENEANGATPSAFATIGDKAGKKGRPQTQWEQLDFDDYLSGASRTTADAVAQRVQTVARNTVQGAAVRGGATVQEVASAVAVDLTPKKLAGFVQPDVQGVYATGRLVQMAREEVPWGVYTNSPELSSQVCEACLERAADPDNPFQMSRADLVEKFETPNPDCYGALSGNGNPCWCVVIGLSQLPEGREDLIRDAQGVG